MIKTEYLHKICPATKSVEVLKTQPDFSSQSFKSIKELTHNNKNYIIAFLGQKTYTQNEQDFIHYRKVFSAKLHEAEKAYNIAAWNFETNSTEDNERIYSERNDQARAIYQDEEALTKLHQFKQKGINDPDLTRHLDKLIERFQESITFKDELKRLDDKEKEISKKFNGYRGMVDGKEYSNGELHHMLETEMDVNKRKQIFKALNGGGDLIAKELVEYVKMRNDFAKKQGYSNFFTYTLDKSYKVKESQLMELLDSLAVQSKDAADRLYTRRDLKAAKAFNISIDELRPWHYDLKTDENPFKEADKYIKSKEDLMPLAEDMYKRMGWNLKELPIEFDIFPRENKNQHGFCFGIDVPTDTRILANLREDQDSLETLNHEIGHAVYNCGISSQLPYLDKEPASSAMTEAIALLNQTLPYREKTFFKEKLNMPEELIDRLEKKRKEDLVNFVHAYVTYINFEKEMYENPDQDLTKLWNDLRNKYNKMNPPDEPMAIWADIPHFLTHPAYLQNYLRAEIMAAQIYKSITDKFGPMTETTKSREFLDANMFAPGASLTEDELMKKLTGSILNPEGFCEQIKDV